jgi:DNA-binding NtrC family response regulator
MSESILADNALTALLETSGRPIYAVDSDGRIAFCNPALEAWMELSAERIVGRPVEYHSDASDGATSSREAVGPLTGLCPPPQALRGQSCAGTVSCSTRDGRLRHRRADFISLHADKPPGDRNLDLPNSLTQRGVIVFLAVDDMTPQELTAEMSAESTPDELHRAIRRFRRSQAGRYAIDSLLGESSAMRKVREQVAAAAASGANVLICGPRGSGHAHVARAIHYHATGDPASDASAKLVPIRGDAVTDDSLRRAVESLSAANPAARRATLLIENIDRLSAPQQSFLVDRSRRGTLAARLIATLETAHQPAGVADPGDQQPPQLLDPALRDLASTITMELPRLIERIDDLPLLSQYFLETANRGAAKQIGSLRPEALDLLALYRWPGELDELRDVITTAHRNATSHAISPADLPAVIHHAAKAAALPRRTKERIVLDDLLTAIEKEAIVRALFQAGGNKTEAAELLGLTRPRLYRRMEQLGLVPISQPDFKRSEDDSQLPDFREIGPEDANE